MQALADVLIAFAAFVGLALFGLLGFVGWKFYTVLRDLRDQIKLLNVSMGGVPAIMSGIKSICMELSGNTLKMSGAAEALRKGLLAEETSDPRRPGVVQYDDADADREYMRQIVEQNEALAAEQSNRFIVGE